MQALLRLLRPSEKPAVPDPRTMALKPKMNWRPAIIAPFMVFAAGMLVHLPLKSAMLLTGSFGVPFGFLVLGFRAVVAKVRLKSFLLNALAHTVLYYVPITLAFVSEFLI